MLQLRPRGRPGSGDPGKRHLGGKRWRGSERPAGELGTSSCRGNPRRGCHKGNLQSCADRAALKGTGHPVSQRGTGKQLLREEPALPCGKGSRHPRGDQAPPKGTGHPVSQGEAASLRESGTACALRRTGTSEGIGHP